MPFTRDDLAALVGFPDDAPVPELLHRTVETRGPLVIERLTFAIGDEEMPALLTRPDSPGPFPAVLYAHAHGGRYDIGMSELVDGRGGLQAPYGPALAASGLAALCLEMPAFGARRTPGENSRAKAHFWHGTTLFGQMLAELASGLSWLAARPDIDAARLAALGFSMGATHALWLAALDARIARVAHLCAFADLATLVEEGAHDRHGLYMIVPGLLAATSTGEIAGRVAPRPQLIGIGYGDAFTPQPAVATALAETKAMYAAAEAPMDALHLVADPRAGHEETPALRQRVMAFLAEMKG